MNLKRLLAIVGAVALCGSALASSGFLANALPAVTVNSTGDASDTSPGDLVCDTGALNSQGAAECTLRAAIEEANAGSVDTIDFNIPTTEPGYSASPLAYTIAPGSGYDDVISPVVIDATTQPGYTGDPIVQLDGSGAAGATAGINLRTDDTTVRGFIVHSFPDEGLEIDGSTGFGDDNTFANNWVGIDAAGNPAPNADNGILVTAGARGNTIGGVGPNDANVVVNSPVIGIFIREPGTDDNVVVGNLVGVAPDGITAMGNGTHGVRIQDVATGNRVGGVAAGSGNVIANNTLGGVTIAADAGPTNIVLGNAVHDNGGLGIDLGDDGVTANDPGDGDSGPNGLLNFPVITLATESAGTVTVDFDLDVPAGDHRIEFFTNAGGTDPSGNGEGEQFAAATTVTHTGSGVESFSHSFAGSVGDVLTATATEEAVGPVYGATSEHSAPSTVLPTTIMVNSTGDAGDSAIGDALCDTGGLNSQGSSECTLRAAIQEANASPVHTIHFDIPTTEAGYSASPLAYTIQPTSQLDDVTAAVTIDATTQPDHPGTPIVELDGSLAGPTADGLRLSGGSITVRGLVVNRFTDDGIRIWSAGGVTVQGSYIGTDVTGTTTAGRGNGAMGVRVSGVGGSLIGGSGPGSGNLIGGSGADGLTFRTPGATGNIAIGNAIGTDQTGSIDLGNADDGIDLRDGAVDNVIGGAGAGEANVIAFNADNGIEVRNATASGNSVLSNSIHSNGRIAIDLVGALGVDVNDGGDADSGSNGLLNHPEITSATESGGTITVDFDLDVPAGDYRIEFFANPSGADPSGYGEAEVFVSATTVTHTGSGSESFTHAFAGAENDIIAATATEEAAGPDYGSSSEVSAAVTTVRATVTVDHLLITTVDDVPSPSGAPGLASWTATEALSFGDPSFTLDPSPTNGTFASVFDLDPHVSGGSAEIDGLHLVSTTLVVGGANSFTLEPGDLLLSTENNETFTVAGFTAADEDIVVFEPAALDDYSTGTFTLLYDLDGFDTGDTVALTLTERTTPVGDGVATVGDLFIGRDGDGDIVKLVLSDVGPGTTTGVESVFVDGGSIGLSDDLHGIEFVEDPILIGGATVPSGRFLIAVESDGETVGSSGRAQTSADAEDVISLDIVTTGDPAVADAYPLFDGSNVGLDTSNEELDGLTFWETAAVGPVYVNSTGDAPDAAPGDGRCDTGGVNSEGDVECTMRAAIEETNASISMDQLRFAIPTSDPGYWGAPVGFTISPGSPLPSVNSPLDVDATSQPGFAGIPLVEIEGSGAGAGTIGLEITAGASSVVGLVVNRFDTGIAVTGGDATSIRGNYIGPDRSGGTGLVGNHDEGVRIAGATNTTIGGPFPEDRNVISGNRLRGIWVDDLSDGPAAASDGTRVVGNLVGTNAAATATLPYTAGAFQQIGIAVWDGPDNVIGAVAEGNVISGNEWYGIYIWGPNAVDNVVQANTIGLDGSGTSPVPNGYESATRAGIDLAQASDTLVGGTAPGEGNVIAGNSSHGLTVVGGSGNAIVSNRIHDNGGLGIDLETDGVTSNDPGDADTGGNDLLNHPEITSAVDTGAAVIVSFTLDVPAGDYRIEFFSNPSGADPTGFGEGEVLTATVTVTHGGTGPETFGHLFAASAGDIVTATATEELAGPSHGSTSEFSASVTVSAASTVRVSDSSRRRSDLVPLGGLNPSVTTPGVAGPALDFDGVDDRLSGPSVDLVTGGLTMSGWVQLDSPGTDPRIVAKTTTEGTTVYELLVDSGTAEAVARVRVGGIVREARGGTVGMGAFHHVAATWDGATLRVFVDGSEVGSTAAAGALDTDVSMEVLVGDVATVDRGLDGRIDEVRIEHTARSADYLATSFANQIDPSSVLTVGAPQTGVPQPWTVAPGQGRAGSIALNAPVTAAGADAWLTAIGLDEPGVEFTTWWWFSTDAGIDLAAGTRTGAAPTDEYETALGGPSGWDLATHLGGTRSQDAPPVGSVSPGAWIEVVIRTDQNGDSSVLVGGAELIAPTAQSGGPATGSVGLRVGQLPGTDAWYVDDARVRRLVTPEPTTALGPLDRP